MLLWVLFIWTLSLDHSLLFVVMIPDFSLSLCSGVSH